MVPTSSGRQRSVLTHEDQRLHDLHRSTSRVSNSWVPSIPYVQGLGAQTHAEHTPNLFTEEHLGLNPNNLVFPFHLLV